MRLFPSDRESFSESSVANKYMDRLELKSAQDRTLGVGVVPNESEFLVLTAATMMKAYVDMDEVAKFDPEWVWFILVILIMLIISFDGSVGRANLIKSTMVQAILYGPYPEVFICFPF